MIDVAVVSLVVLAAVVMGFTLVAIGVCQANIYILKHIYAKLKNDNRTNISLDELTDIMDPGKLRDMMFVRRGGIENIDA